MPQKDPLTLEVEKLCAIPRKFSLSGLGLEMNSILGSLDGSSVGASQGASNTKSSGKGPAKRKPRKNKQAKAKARHDKIEADLAKREAELDKREAELDNERAKGEAERAKWEAELAQREANVTAIEEKLAEAMHRERKAKAKHDEREARLAEREASLANEDAKRARHRALSEKKAEEDLLNRLKWLAWHENNHGIRRSRNSTYYAVHGMGDYNPDPVYQAIRAEQTIDQFINDQHLWRQQRDANPRANRRARRSFQGRRFESSSSITQSLPRTPSTQEGAGSDPINARLAGYSVWHSFRAGVPHPGAHTSRGTTLGDHFGVFKKKQASGNRKLQGGNASDMSGNKFV